MFYSSDQKKTDIEVKLDLQKIIDAFPLYILLVDAEHHIIMANQAVTSQLNVNHKNIIGGYCPKVIHGLETPYPGCPLEEAVNVGSYIEKELYDEQHGRWLSSAVYPIGIETEEGHQIYLHTVYDITDRKKAEEELKVSLARLQLMTDGVIDALGKTVESRDAYTAGHQQRVSKLACRIASEMNLFAGQVEGIRVAALLHDIGKIAVPSEILNKSGKMNAFELNIIKMHCQAGHDILKDIDFPWPVAEVVLQHHERENGSGYPLGLSQREIRLEAKILIVADVVEAMSFRRPYREALGLEKAMQEIESKKGVLYDPKVVEACLQVVCRQHFSF